MYSKISKCCNLHNLLRYNLQVIPKNSVRPYGLAKPNTKSKYEGDRKSSYKGDSELYSEQMRKVKDFYRVRNYLPLRLFENCIKIGTSTGLLEQNMSDGLFLLKCCGKTIIDGDVNQKKNFAQTIWKTMLKGNTNVTHCNAFLSSAIENNEDVNVDEFLQQMQKGNIRPNIITYSKIIEYFCSNGKMEGAYDILEQMKSENMTIGESIFNSLILGNARINNPEGCKQVLDVMNENGMKRDVDTYSTLLLAYTEMNLADEVENLLKEVKEKDMFFNFSAIMDSFTVAIVNNSDKIRQLVYQEFPEKIDVANGANAFRLLLVNKEYESATELILKITHPNFVMAKILIEYAPFDVAVDMTEKCVKNERGGLQFGPLLQACLTSEKSNGYINKLLKYFDNTTDRTLNANTISDLLGHVFNSDIVSYRLLANIITIGFNSKLPMRALLKRDVFPYLHNSKPALHIHESLIPHMAYGYLQFIASLMEYLIQGGKFSEAATYAEKTRFNGNLTYAERNLFNALLDNFESPIARIIRLRRPADSSRFVMNFDAFLQGINRLEDAKQEKMSNFIKALNSYNCFIPTTNQEEILKKCLFITEESAKELAMMSEERRLDLPERTRTSLKMGKHEADSLVDKSIKHMDKIKINRLITYYSENKDQENLTRLSSELSENGENVNTGALWRLLQAFCTAVNDVEGARKIWNLFKSQNVVPMTYLVLDYSTLLINSSSFDEAIDALKVLEIEHEMSHDQRHMPSALQKLLISSIENCTSEQRDELSAHLRNVFPKEEGRIKLLLNYYSFMKGNLSLEEMVSALESCKDCSEILPFRNFSTILGQCIATNNAELTKRVYAVDCASNGVGSAMSTLAFEFFMCGKTRQSAHLFQTFGLELHDHKLEYFCRMIRNKDVNLFEEFLKVTNGVRLNRSRLYSTVLSAYANANDAQKALTVWIKAEEENVEIHSEILYRVESLLKLNNLEVPFSIAKDVEEKDNNNTKPRNAYYEKSRIENDNISKNENIEQSSHFGRNDIEVFGKVIRGRLSVKDGIERYNELPAHKRFLCHDIPKYLDLKTDMEKGEYVKNLADLMEEAPNEGGLLFSLLELETRNPHSIPHLLRIGKTLSLQQNQYETARFIFHKFLALKNFDAALDFFESVVTTTNISDFIGDFRNYRKNFNDVIEFCNFVKDENRQDENLHKCITEYKSFYFAKFKRHELTEHIASTSQIHPFSNYNPQLKYFIEQRIKGEERMNRNNIDVDFLK